MFVKYCYKKFQATQMPLNKSHGIEASYITVHLYDILIINTRPPWLLALPQTCVITKISHS